MNPIVVLVIGTVMLFGLGWQLHLVRRDLDHWDRERPPARVLPAAVFGLVVVVGTMIYGVVCLMDGRRVDVDLGTTTLWNFKAVLFLGTVTIKAYFGPVVNAFVLCSALYALGEHGELRAIPVLQTFADWMFDAGPEWLSVVWIILSLVYCFLASGVDSVFEWGE